MSEPARELGADEARAHFADVLNEAAYGGRITYVTRRGKRLAAIVPVDAAEYLERLEDEHAAREALAALERIDSGETPVPLEQIRAELGL